MYTPTDRLAVNASVSKALSISTSTGSTIALPIGPAVAAAATMEVRIHFVEAG